MYKLFDNTPSFKSLLYNFWLGKIRLWKSYWIVGELINALIILLIFNIEINYFKNKMNIYLINNFFCKYI